MTLFLKDILGYALSVKTVLAIHRCIFVRVEYLLLLITCKGKTWSFITSLTIYNFHIALTFFFISFRYATLKRSAREANLVLFTDERLEALEQSVSILDLNSDFFSVFSYFITLPPLIL